VKTLHITPLSTEPPPYWYQGRRITFVERQLHNGRYVVWVQRGDGMESDWMLVDARDVKHLPPMGLFGLLRQLPLPLLVLVRGGKSSPARREYRVYRFDASAQMRLALAA